MALHSRQIAESFERRLNEPADPAQARRMLVACNGFARRSAEFADRQAELLGQIMLSQDFQDLSGQVIKKVLDVITRTEQQLVAVLRDCAPQELAAPQPEAAAELDGPQVPDKAMAQGDVDDLLASLGF
jgi:chemotaxis protein CheZ